jgi:CYTH domain-containing protein
LPERRAPHHTLTTPCAGQNAAMIGRDPGASRYAHVEREQRWLLRALPEGLRDPVAVTDRYFPRSTLRLRRMASGTDTVRKLGQKARSNPSSPEVAATTNLYLTEEEFALFAQLEGAPLHKTRWHWTVADREISVDQFAQALDGLVLAELELSPDEPFLDPPPLAVSDVTHDDRFSGGHLAGLSPDAAVSLLADVAAWRAQAEPV